jgi:hypothetical protein
MRFKHGGRRENSGRKMQGKAEKVSVSIAFEPEILERVDHYAKDIEKSRSAVVEKFCKKSLDEVGY